MASREYLQAKEIEALRKALDAAERAIDHAVAGAKSSDELHVKQRELIKDLERQIRADRCGACRRELDLKTDEWFTFKALCLCDDCTKVLREHIR